MVATISLLRRRVWFEWFRGFADAAAVIDWGRHLSLKSFWVYASPGSELFGMRAAASLNISSLYVKYSQEVDHGALRRADFRSLEKECVESESRKDRHSQNM